MSPRPYSWQYPVVLKVWFYLCNSTALQVIYPLVINPLLPLYSIGFLYRFFWPTYGNVNYLYSNRYVPKWNTLYSLWNGSSFLYNTSILSSQLLLYKNHYIDLHVPNISVDLHLVHPQGTKFKRRSLFNFAPWGQNVYCSLWLRFYIFFYSIVYTSANKISQKFSCFCKLISKILFLYVVIVYF